MFRIFGRKRRPPVHVPIAVALSGTIKSMAVVNLQGIDTRAKLTVGSTDPAVNYDFFVAPTQSSAGYSGPLGGTGAGTITDPWSLAYAWGTGGGTAQGAGKLPTTGARVAIRGGANGVQVKYNGTTTRSLDAHGSVGTGVDNSNGKLIFEGYRTSENALPERACIFGDQVSPDVDFLSVNGNYVWLKDLEIARGWSSRDYSTFNGVAVYAVGTTNGFKMIHCDVHDGENGIYSEHTVGRMEIYGCWLRNNGLDPVFGPGGHGIYLHHKDPATRFIIDENIFGSTYAFCMQIYHDGTFVEAMDMTGNITYNGFTLAGSSGLWPQGPRGGFNVVLGSQTGARDITCTDHISYFPNGYGDAHFQAPYASSTNKISLIRPYCVGAGDGSGCLWIEGTFATQTDFTLQDGFFRPDLTSSQKSCVYVTQAGSLSYNWSGNQWVRDPNALGWIDQGTIKNWNNFKTGTGLGGSDPTPDATDPTSAKIFVRPTTRYAANRGHVAIYNWANLTNVPVDLSSILSNGHRYAIYDNRDPWHSIATGTWNGTPVNFPMNTQVTDPTPEGGFSANPPPQTVPFFNAFIVRRTP